MKHFDTWVRVGIHAIIAVILVACSAGGLPNVDDQQSASVPNSPDGMYLPLMFSAPKTALSLGDTIQLSATGGKLPYTYRTNTGVVTDSGVFSANALGSAHVIVTDSQTPPQTAFVDLTIGQAAAPAPNPTPTPSAPAPAPTPAPVVQPSRPIYRLFNTIHGLHQISYTNTATGDGWTPEGSLYSLYTAPVAGMRPVFICQINGPIPAYFQSNDAGCEGNQLFSIAGYAWDKQQAGTIALVRFSKVYSYNGQTLSDHLDLRVPNLSNVVGPAGYRADGVLGFVPN